MLGTNKVVVVVVVAVVVIVGECAVASWLVCSTRDRAVGVRALAAVFFGKALNSSLAVPLSKLVYK